jgi:hypothetical protein
VNIMQRNSLGYKTIDGVQCDINEAHTDDIGAFSAAAVPTPAPPPAPGFTYPSTDDMIKQIWEQMFGPQSQGWAALFGTTGGRGKFTVEAIADLHKQLP